MNAFYYNDNLEPKEFEVLRDNKDGTVDLGRGGTLVVGKCKVVDGVKLGHCTLGKTPATVILPPDPISTLDRRVVTMSAN